MNEKKAKMLRRYVRLTMNPKAPKGRALQAIKRQARNVKTGETIERIQVINHPASARGRILFWKRLLRKDPKALKFL